MTKCLPRTLSILCFWTSFLIASFGCHALLDWPEPWEQRIEMFKSRSDEFDVVAVGSSRVLHNLDPAVLEAGLAYPDSPGISVYNIGVRGFGGHGIDYVLRRLGSSLNGKTVLIEAYGFGSRMSLGGDGAFDRRDLRWHDFFQTISVLRTAWDEGAGILPVTSASTNAPWTNRLIEHYARLRAWPRRLSEFAIDASAHLGLFLRRHLPVGLGLSRARNRTTSNEPEIYGYVPMDSLSPRFDFTPADWKVKVDEIIASRKRLPVSGVNDWAFKRQLEFLRTVRPGIAVYINFPHGYLDSSSWQARVADWSAGADPPPAGSNRLFKFLDYNDPARYPELFVYDARADTTHLNARATGLFSRKIALDVRSLISPARSSPATTIH